MAAPRAGIRVLRIRIVKDSIESSRHLSKRGGEVIEIYVKANKLSKIVTSKSAGKYGWCPGWVVVRMGLV